MHLILLEEAQPSGFGFWFLSEALGGILVFALLYIFIIKNPKINKRKPDRNEEKD